MDLNLLTFAPAIKAIGGAGVPFLEQGLTAILSGVSGPFGLLVSPILNTIWPAINGAMGLAPDAAPEATAAAIQADPDAAQKLQVVADQHHDLIQQAMAKDQLAEQDVENARGTMVQLVQAKSPLADGAAIVSALAVIGFFLVAVLAMMGYGQTNPSAQWVVGAAITGWTAVLSYWIGSSKGSADKSADLASIAHAAIGQATAKRGVSR